MVTYRYVVETHYKKHEKFNGYEFDAKTHHHAIKHIQFKLNLSPYNYKKAKIKLRRIANG